jgi:hypothetical protein
METDIPIDVDLLAETCGIPIHEESIQGFLGLWLHFGSCEGIVLAEGQIPRRRRFTLAHELGHACLPTHRKSAGLKCLETDLIEGESDRTIESEANAFAAELLAPRKLVTPMLSTGAIGIRKADQIAERFDISLTSAVRRVVEYSREPAAMVLCEGPKVKWSVRRNHFPYGLPGAGDKIPPGSIAKEIVAGQQGSLDPRNVERLTWLPDASGHFTLMESAIRLGGLDQVLSLLWIPNLEGANDEESA